jgi:heme/copper-type cytochrome/quinol oxidase subunit 2
MNESQPQPRDRNPLILMLVRRGVIFFALMGLFSVFLYGLGTMQEFTDPTQFMLIRLSIFFGILLFCSAVYGFVLNFAFMFRFRFRKKTRVIAAGPGSGHFHFFRNLWFYTNMAILSLLITLGMAFIMAVTGGNSPQS